MDNPFKLLEAYGATDKHLFYGREKEINSLYHLLQQSQMTLVYGASGTGKTSLLNAGLPKAFKITDWFKISIRRRDNINESLMTEIQKELKVTEQDFFSLPQSLQEIFESRWIPIFLIFDQFEEIFTLGSHEERLIFFTTIHEILEQHTFVKVIFSMREEYIGHLYDYEFILPSLFDKRFRVEPMNDDVIIEVIYKTCRYHQVILEEKKETARKIKDRVKTESKRPVHLPHLQIYLYALYEKVCLHDSIPQFLNQNVEEPAHSLPIFLKAFIIDTIASGQVMLREKFPKSPDDLAENILNEFATQEGTKVPQKVTFLAEKHNQPISVIAKLLQFFDERGKLLRADENYPDRYEPVHDLVALQIHEGRSTEEKAYRAYLGKLKLDYQSWENAKNSNDYLLKPDQILEYELFEEKIEKEIEAGSYKKYFDRSNKHIKINTLIKRAYTIGITLLAIVSLIGMVSTFSFLKQVEHEKENVKLEKENAEEATCEAEHQTYLAELSKQAAEKKEEEVREAFNELEKEQKAKYLAQAREFREKNQFDDAITAYIEASKLSNPRDSILVLSSIAQVRLDKRQNDFEIARRRGLSLAAIGECEAALLFLEKAQLLKPKNQTDNDLLTAINNCQK